MALSEREQRLLDEMERNLYQSEADVLDASSGARSAPSYRSTVIGVVIVALGLAATLGGVISHLLFIGVLGFIAMLFGALYIFSPKGDQRQRGNQTKASRAKNSSTKSRQSFADRMQDRWEERGNGLR